MCFSQQNKLTLIGNLAFLLALLMRYFPVLQGTSTESILLILGLVLSMVLNIGWLVRILYDLIAKKIRPEINLLTILNLFIILVQLYLLIL